MFFFAAINIVPAAIYFGNGIIAYSVMPLLNLITGFLEITEPKKYLQFYHGRDIADKYVNEEDLLILASLKLGSGIYMTLNPILNFLLF